MPPQTKPVCGRGPSCSTFPDRAGPCRLRTSAHKCRRRYIYLGFRGDGLVGPRSFLSALDGEPPPIRSMPWIRMSYSTCTKRSSRLDMTLWQVRDCLITREIKRSGDGARVGEHVCECGLSVLSSGARCLVVSFQVMRLSSLRACLESGTSSIARLSPAEGCLACPDIAQVVIFSSTHLVTFVL